MKLDFCYFTNDKKRNPDTRSFHKMPFGIVDGKINYNINAVLFTTEETFRNYKSEMPEKEHWKFKDAFVGIILKSEGSYILENERVLVIDIDMKNTQHYSFSDDERRAVYIIVCELFGIPLNYPEMEKTQSKGIHIFAKVKREQILRNGSFFIDDKTFLPVEEQTGRKIEVEIFQESQCIITAPSKTYFVWKKSENKIDWKNLMLLETLPDAISWEKESNKKTRSERETKMNVGINPELERKLELIYKDLFFEPLEKELSTLKFDYSQQPFQVFRMATSENLQIFQREDKTFFIQEITFKKQKRNFKKSKYYTNEMLEKLEQRKDKLIK